MPLNLLHTLQYGVQIKLTFFRFQLHFYWVLCLSWVQAASHSQLILRKNRFHSSFSSWSCDTFPRLPAGLTARVTWPSGLTLSSTVPWPPVLIILDLGCPFSLLPTLELECPLSLLPTLKLECPVCPLWALPISSFKGLLSVSPTLKLNCSKMSLTATLLSGSLKELSHLFSWSLEALLLLLLLDLLIPICSFAIMLPPTSSSSAAWQLLLVCCWCWWWFLELFGCLLAVLPRCEVINSRGMEEAIVAKNKDKKYVIFA